MFPQTVNEYTIVEIRFTIDVVLCHRSFVLNSMSNNGVKVAFHFHIFLVLIVLDLLLKNL